MPKARAAAPAAGLWPGLRLPEGRAPQVDNWTGGVAGKPAAARRAAPKKSRRFR